MNMFTGLVEDRGSIVAVEETPGGARLRVGTRLAERAVGMDASLVDAGTVGAHVVAQLAVG